MKTSLREYLQSIHKTHLIYDFDETIVKLSLPWEILFDEISRELINEDKTIYENLKKNRISTSDARNNYVLRFGEKIRPSITRAWTQFEKENLQGYVKNDSLIDFIKMEQGYKMSIWSSNSRSTVVKILQELNIVDKFSPIVCGEDVVLLKPYTE